MDREWGTQCSLDYHKPCVGCGECRDNTDDYYEMKLEEKDGARTDD